MAESSGDQVSKEGWIDITDDIGKMYLGSTVLGGVQDAESDQGK